MRAWSKNKLSEVIVYNRIHVVACASVASWSWAQLTNTSVTTLPLLTVFIIMFCIYGWNRLFDLKEDHINSPRRARSSKRLKKILFYVSLSGTGLCLILAPLTGNMASGLLLATVVLLGFLYSTPLPASSNCKFRLKNIPIVKNVTSGIGWSLMTVFFPALYASQQVTTKHWIAAGLMFGAVWIVELIWDIRDQKGDRLAKVQTIPVLKGLEMTQKWIFSINSLTALSLLTGYSIGVLPAYWLLILLNNLLVYIWLSQNEQMLLKRSYSHLLVGLQTLLLVLLGYIASYFHWLGQFQLI